MGKQRGRPPIKPSIKQFICAKALEHKDTPRQLLAIELKKLIEEAGEVSPTEDTMIKKISEARNKPKSPLDEQWSLGYLAQYDIPPDALPIVMRIYEKRLRELKQDFTIREAMWIARLSKCTDDLIVLERFATVYALTEKVNWILGKTTHDRHFDIKLLQAMDKRITSSDYVKSDDIIYFNDSTGLSPEPNATCSKCGRTCMLSEGFM